MSRSQFIKLSNKQKLFKFNKRNGKSSTFLSRLKQAKTLRKGSLPKHQLQPKVNRNLPNLHQEEHKKINRENKYPCHNSNNKNKCPCLRQNQLQLLVQVLVLKYRYLMVVLLLISKTHRIWQITIV